MLLTVSCQGATQQPAAALVPPPAIEPLVARRILPGDVLALRGQNFGLDPGQVMLGERSLQVLEWSDGKVLARLPRDVAPGAATVTLRSLAGNAQANVRIADPYFAPGVREISCHNDFSYCSVYLPPTYDSEPNRRFPVVYHFQGSGWNNRLVAESAEIARLAEPYGFILVFDFQIMADEAPLRLAREIDEAYRTLPRAEARGMWVTSASGRGLRIAAEHPGVFGAVDGSFACFGSFDPEKARQLRIRLDIGDLDATCGGATLRAHEQLAQAGIPHLYEVYPGGRHAPQSMFSDPTIKAVLDFFKGVFPGA